MEMKKVNSGRLRAIGYDARARLLQVLTLARLTVADPAPIISISRQFQKEPAYWTLLPAS